MKKRTCKYGWTDNMAIAEKLGREIARRDLDAGVKMLDDAKISHKKHVKHLRAVTTGGVQPLSRMHPDHPVRRKLAFLPPHEAFSATQKFVP